MMFKPVSLILLLISFLISPLLAKPAAVWAVSDGERVLQNDLNHPLKAVNGVWNGERVEIFGARNETLAFQIIVEAGDSPLDKVSIKLPELKSESGHSIRYKAPALDPSQYVDRPIHLYSVHYMNVPRISSANWIFETENSKPKGGTGMVPVQLVPENALKGRGGFPVKVDAKKNQAFWVEIYINKDCPTDLYHGEIEVKSGRWSKKIPLLLKVFDFTLPDENSMKMMLCFDYTQIDRYHGKQISQNYHRFAHRNRVEFSHAYSPESATKAKGRFTGSDFTKENGYEGPGENVGNEIIPRTFYGPRRLFVDEATSWKTSDEWMSFLNKNFPGKLTFVYMPDEPGKSQYPGIHRIAKDIRSSPGPGKHLNTFVTSGYNKGLDGAIDIWCHYISSHRVETSKKIREKGQQVWIYNGVRPNSGAFVHETPATDARSIAWACFRHEIPVYFYWMVNHWYHNFQRPQNRTQNVWIDPVTFDNRKQPNKRDRGFINGDGVLIYPGEDVQFPDQNRGISGPCSSMRMANLRRGAQDHLYLTMAQKKFPERVKACLKKIVPNVLGETDRSKGIGFETKADKYDEVRRILADLIVAEK